MPDPQVFGFGSFRLMSQRRELLFNGDTVQLGSRAFDLLLALVKRQGQLATKDELMAEIWPGTIVEENSLHSLISVLRKVLAGDAGGARFLQTVPGRGYRFVARVEHEKVVGSSGPGATGSIDPTVASLPLPDKPSIAILPFTNMSADPDQEYFVDGLVEDITTEMSKFVNCSSSLAIPVFTYKGKGRRCKGRRARIRCPLRARRKHPEVCGSRARDRAARRCRFDVHVRADRYEGGLQDVFALQDEITLAVVGAIEPQLRQAELERTRSKPTDNLDAYDLYLRALPLLRPLEREGFRCGREVVAEGPSNLTETMQMRWRCSQTSWCDAR